MRKPLTEARKIVRIVDENGGREAPDPARLKEAVRQSIGQASRAQDLTIEMLLSLAERVERLEHEAGSKQ